MAAPEIVIELDVIGLQSFENLKKTTTEIGAAAKKMNATFADQSKAMVAVAEDIEGAFDGFDKLRGAVDQTGDALRLFGRSSKQLADHIEDNISDPALRAKVAMMALNARLKRGPSLLDRMSDRAAVFKTRMVIAAGGVKQFNLAVGAIKFGVIGGGLAALAVGVAALKKAFDFTSDAIGRYIETNERATEAQKILNSAIDNLLVSFGRAVVGGDDVSDTMVRMAFEFQQITIKINKHAKTIRTIFKTVVTFIVGVPSFVAIGVLGVTGLVLHSMENMANSVFEVIAGVLKKAKSFLAAVQTGLKLLGEEMIASKLEGAIESLDRKIKGFNDRIDHRLTKDFVRFTREIIDLTDAMLTLGDASGKVDLPPIGAGKGQRRGKGTKKKTGRAAGTTTKDEPGRDALEAAEAVAAPQSGMDIIAGGRTATEMMKDFNEQLRQFAKDADDLVTGGLSGLVSGLSELTGQLISGSMAWGEFGSAIMQMFAQLASQIGDFFILNGLGMGPLTGGAMSGPLIAAGVGLKVLAGVMGGLASSKGTSAGSGGGVGSAFLPQDHRRPDDQRETNIKIVILGEDIERPVVDWMDSAMRRGQFRNFAPAGG